MTNLPSVRLFLIDGIGALVSATFLGLILIQLNEYIGMPINVLYILALIALIFAVYSFGCYFTKPKRWQIFLKIIAFLNSLYLLLTISLIVTFYSLLTHFGFAYFIIESIILIGLIRMEWMESIKS